ncbi:hypothetical protein B0H63DRAFT_486690 [Podospora didyma]|uniref:Uncharacterized protein n=1 Tax=Podospora didyma TaxID=330526 RepID=A0AAE0K533_9PEZI|nr:hypothetical protein B0H63DRAFT_486690 [Podospora didyma]
MGIIHPCCVQSAGDVDGRGDSAGRLCGISNTCNKREEADRTVTLRCGWCCRCGGAPLSRRLSAEEKKQVAVNRSTALHDWLSLTLNARPLEAVALIQAHLTGLSLALPSVMYCKKRYVQPVPSSLGRSVGSLAVYARLAFHHASTLALGSLSEENQHCCKPACSHLGERKTGPGIEPIQLGEKQHPLSAARSVLLRGIRTSWRSVRASLKDKRVPPTVISRLPGHITSF